MSEVTPEVSVEAVVDAPVDASAPAEGETPPWGDDFDAARAWTTIKSLREVEKQFKADKADRERLAKEAADAEKSEVEKLQARLAEVEGELSKKEHAALVSSIAREAGVPDELVDFLTAKDEEGLKVQAERLASMKPSAPAVTRPKPRLVSGSAPDDVAESVDPAAIAARIRANS